jgi:hypothetical protein
VFLISELLSHFQIFWRPPEESSACGEKESLWLQSKEVLIFGSKRTDDQTLLTELNPKFKEK